MIHAGIDTGGTGAIAIISDGLITIADYPGSAILMMGLLDGLAGATVILEKIHLQPKDHDHLRSAEKLVRNHQQWATCLELVGADVQHLEPAQWRKLAGYRGGSNKDAAIEYALQLYPEMQPQLMYKSRNGRWARKDGRAEALLMAHGARIL
jgi:hypothetical protein